MSKKSYMEGFCKTAASHGIDPMALAALVAPMKKNAGVIDSLAANWAQLSPATRMAISTLGTGAVGAGIGGIVGKPKKKKLAALIGLLAGGVTGAAANSLINAPEWLQQAAMRGSQGLVTGDTDKDLGMAANLSRWLASNNDGVKGDAYGTAALQIETARALAKELKEDE